MKNLLDGKVGVFDQLSCFGEFQLDNPICKKLCALSIRCAIEYEQNTRMEILEDIASTDGIFIKIQ